MKKYNQQYKLEDFIIYNKKSLQPKRDMKDALVSRTYVRLSNKFWAQFHDKYATISVSKDGSLMKITPSDNRNDWVCSDVKGTIRVGSVRLLELLGIEKGGKEAYWSSTLNSVIVEL